MIITIVGSNYLIFTEEWQDLKIQLTDVLNYLEKSQTIISLNVFKDGKREQLGKFDKINDNVWINNIETDYRNTSIRNDVKLLKESDRQFDIHNNIKKISN